MFSGVAGAAITGTALVAGLWPTRASAATAYVDTTSDQTIGGVKTFTSSPVVPAASFPETAVAGLVSDLAAKAPATGPFAPSTPGASAPTRFVGGTASGPPTSGTFATGDLVVDQTGNVWVCTTGGSPGVWAPGGAGTSVPKTQIAESGTAVPVFMIQPDVAARGPFGFTVGDSLFNSTRDFVGYFGYNAANGSQRYNGAEHSFAWVHESDYEVGPGTHWCESYTEYRNKNGGGSFRPWFLAIDKATDIIQEHSFSGAPFTFKGQGGGTLADITAKGTLRSFGVAGQDAAWECHAPAGRTPQLIGLSGSVERFHLSGNADYQAALSVQGIRVALFQAFSPSNVNFSVGGDGGTLAAIVATAPQTATVALAARQFSTDQVAPILGIYNSNNTVHFGGFNKSGHFTTKKTVAPADGDVAPGELALWFDSTNGAARLMVKAKQADGTVRTGTVSLT